VPPLHNKRPRVHYIVRTYKVHQTVTDVHKTASKHRLQLADI